MGEEREGHPGACLGDVVRQPHARSLPPVVEVDAEKCVNCHACIAACPVKYCNDGSGDHVVIDPDTCIGCGQCIRACTHQARQYHDDFPAFLADLAAGVPMVAIVAPAAASGFPGQLPNLVGWLKRQGVKAVFDVSFGAELTVYSMLQLLRRGTVPPPLIASPCPALVTCIEIYHPELLPHLAPVASPMVHTMRMIRREFPQFAGCRIAVVSPCAAKKREFLLHGIGDYNLGFRSVQRHFDDSGDNLAVYPAGAFEGPPAERAVLFPTPGGLMATVLRHLPEMDGQIRRIEGRDLAYPYLKSLGEAIRTGHAPPLVDGLSCDYGCNAGPLTRFAEMTPDEAESWIARRKAEHIAAFRQAGGKEAEKADAALEALLAQHWSDDLAAVTPENLAANNRTAIPGEERKWEIFGRMHKHGPKDCYNCTACGYNSCEGMAVAGVVAAGKPENCHFYLAKASEMANLETRQRERRLNNILTTCKEGFVEVDNDFRIVAVNPEMCRIFGRAVNDLLGQPIDAFTDDAGRREFARQQELRRQGRRTSYEVAFLHGPGEAPVHCLVNASPLKDEEGRKVGSFALVTDITELRRTLAELTDLKDHLEQKVEERTTLLSEANRELESFSYSVSHDLRAPLRSIDGFSQALLEDCLASLPEDGREYLRRIRGASQKMGQLIDDILSLSRVSRHVLRREQVDLSRLARDILRELAEAEPARQVRTEVEPGMTVVGDAHLLAIALRNLLGNAWKFTGKTENAEIRFATEPGDDGPAYRISDNGAGFDMKYVGKLFGVFQRLHDASDFPGTGIGLSIVRRIVARHGGEIEAESAPGKGASFRFTLKDIPPEEEA